MTANQPASCPAGVNDAAAARGGLAEHLPSLLRQAEIQTIELDVLHRRPSFQGGEISPQAQSITRPARDEHRARGFGFWEFVLADAVATDFETQQGLMSAALRHNSGDSTRVRMGREEFVDRLTRNEYENLPPRALVSFCSSVYVAGHDAQPMHLPLLDLGVAPGADGEKAAIAALQALGLRGLLFESGRSYHFYGEDPVSSPDLTVILARAQLLAPIIDSRWVSHQLIDGRCGLRISTDSEKTPTPPVFVARVLTP